MLYYKVSKITIKTSIKKGGMAMIELVVAGKVVAFGASCAGVLFSIKHNWYKASMSWSFAAVVLWGIIFAAH